jgi:hypothetical protein
LGQRLTPSGTERLGDAEVRHHRLAFVQHDVFRLDIAMDHAVGMRVAQRRRNLATNPDGFLHRELRLAPKSRAERFASHERHDIVKEAIGLTRVEQGENVRVAQLRGDFDLALEPLPAQGLGQVRVKDLDRDGAPMFAVLGLIDGGHAPTPDLPLQLVTVLQRALQTLRKVRHGTSIGSHGV